MRTGLSAGDQRSLAVDEPRHTGRHGEHPVTELSDSGPFQGPWNLDDLTDREKQVLLTSATEISWGWV